ncbi:MAG: hypothetical protein FJ191_12085 [Gammaproteobacteria bacterium]|nr:hypothetical protein [Gammaproteobacteria bacterium]
MHRSGPLRRGWRQRHPLSKALLSGSLLTTALALPHPGGLLVALVAAALVVGRAGVSVRQFWRAARAPLAFVLLTALTVAPRIHVTTSGMTIDGFSLDAVWPLFTRSLGALAAMLLLTLSTPAADLLRLLQRLGVPVAVAEVGLGMLRLLDILGEERQRLQQVMTLRGGTVSTAAQRRSATAMASTLFQRGIRRADRLERALQLRSPGGLLATQPGHEALRAYDVAWATAVATIPLLMWWSWS